MNPMRVLIVKSGKRVRSGKFQMGSTLNAGGEAVRGDLMRKGVERGALIFEASEKPCNNGTGGVDVVKYIPFKRNGNRGPAKDWGRKSVTVVGQKTLTSALC